MALLVARNDRAVQSTHRRKEGGGAIALVVVGHGRGTAGLHRQAGLGAIKRLHLALLVATQNQRVLGRGHIQTDDVFEFLDKLGVARHLETLYPVRLQTACRPNTLHRGVAHASHRRERASAPLGGAFGLGLRGQTHDLRGIHRGFAPATRQILLDGFQSARRVTLAPTAHLNAAYSNQLGDLAIVQPIGRQQHDAHATRQSHFRRVRMRQLHESLPLRVVQFNRTCHAHRRPQRKSDNSWIRRIVFSSINYKALH